VIAALSLLATAATAATAQAQSPTDRGTPASWWSGLWGSSKPKPKDGPDAARRVSEAERERELERLEKALLRRGNVCLRLQEIAEASGDDALRDEAVRLLEAACALHKRQVQALGMDLPRSGGGEPDEGPITLPPVSREVLMTPLPARSRSGSMEAGITPPSRSWEGDR
jgi:hypothetical protein